MATVNEIVAFLRLRGGEQFTREVKGRATQIKDSFMSINNALAGAGAFLFLRKISDDANLATNAMMGLQSVASFKGIQGAEQAAAQLNAVKEGFLSNHEAAQALKNLLSRGYNLDQAVQVLNRLGESAAFGRAAHLSFGEAVVSATEGLRQENSILVDNAGVTKNVAKMWEDYAKSLGVGVNTLTQQQKVQAEINGIMAETQAQVGDLAKLSNDAAGEQARLASTTTKASASLGQMAQILAAPFLNALNTMVDAFNRAPSALQNFIGALGAVVVAIKLFGTALTTLLPMIGPGGWVLIALGAVATLFFTLEANANRTAKAVGVFRQSLADLSLEQAEQKLVELNTQLAETEKKIAAFNKAKSALGMLPHERNLQQRDILAAEIAELQKFIADKRKAETTAAAGTLAGAGKLSKKEKQLLDNQREYEFAHQQITRAQYIAYLSQRINDFQKFSNEWIEIDEELKKQQLALQVEEFSQTQSVQDGLREDELGRFRQHKAKLSLIHTEEREKRLEEEKRTQEFIDAIAEEEYEVLEQKKAQAQEVSLFLSESLAAISESLVGVAMEGGKVFKAFWKSVLLTALEAIERYFLLAKIKSIIETVINPFSALKSIAPLAVAMGLLQAARGQIAALAQGSVITQPTLALAGESLGAGNRFEVVAPERDFMSYSNELINRVLAQRNEQQPASRGRGDERKVNVIMNFNSPLTDDRQAQRMSRAVIEPEVERAASRRKR